MNTISFTYKMEPGGRFPRLWLAKPAEGEAVCFANKQKVGESIPNWCQVLKTWTEPNGKWTATHYEIALAPGVVPIYLLARLHVPWGTELVSWGDAVNELNLSIELCRQIISTEYPAVAARLDANEAFMAAYEAEKVDTEVVTFFVSFGSNRALHEAKDQPREAETRDGRRVIIAPGENGWYGPVVIEPADAKIDNVIHTPGIRGGEWRISVLVPVRS